MALRTLSPKELDRMMELAELPQRPIQIVELKEKIENETKALELRASVKGPDSVKREEILAIVAMRLELDNLYDLWTLGKL